MTLTVRVPDDDDAPVSPTELDLATGVYGARLPRSPFIDGWRGHSEAVLARLRFLHEQDRRAERAERAGGLSRRARALWARAVTSRQKARPSRVALSR
ncbi:MAG: hypothetical protein CMN93_08170 [Synechococcus sp. CPC35]|nr:hypothetical protein [Synechococcus sp. CPC35]